MKFDRHLAWVIVLYAASTVAPRATQAQSSAQNVAANTPPATAEAARSIPAPEREAPRDSAAAPGYVLGPEDVVEVFVWKNPELSSTATVRPDGRITLPLAGELVAAGKTPEELRTAITAQLKRYVELPYVTVMVKAINSPQISVLGEVRKPGRYRLAQRASILDAIAMGGGFTEYADGKDVLVLRQTPGGGTRRIKVNVKSLLRDGNPLRLEPGDTVYVD
jgi:polysaccharide export outer membrane protein